MKKNKITEIDGWGTFVDAKTISVEDDDGNTEEITGDTIIIATGATTRLIPGTELSERVVTYEEQILDEELPGSIVIAGSGAIGVEFAYMMKNFGVDVTIVEFLDRMVPTEDEEVSKELAKHYKKLGVNVLLGTKVESIDDSGDKVKVTVSKDGKEEVLETDKVLQAIGFAPRLDGYGLDKTGVETTDRGAIAIDERGRTNVENVYAIGDVTGKLMLAHTAEAMGVVAAETIAGAETVEIDFDMIPRATYCQPQIASFGYSEAQAKEKGYDVKVAKFPFSANGKAKGLGDGGRLRQDRGRREVQRDHRRPPHRPRRHRAAAGADPGSEVGPHRRRGRSQRLRPPDPVRGRQGGRRGHRRPHDQPLSRLQVRCTATAGQVVGTSCSETAVPSTTSTAIQTGQSAATPTISAGKRAVTWSSSTVASTRTSC